MLGVLFYDTTILTFEIVNEAFKFFSSDRFFLVAQAVLKHHSSLSILRAVTHLALNIVSVFPDLVFQFSLCSLTLIPIADLIVLPTMT